MVKKNFNNYKILFAGVGLGRILLIWDILENLIINIFLE